MILATENWEKMSAFCSMILVGISKSYVAFDLSRSLVIFDILFSAHLLVQSKQYKYSKSYFVNLEQVNVGGVKS